jgi:hypothetical protein
VGACLSSVPERTELVNNPDPKNPFDLVKATDLTDFQIEHYWVDLPGASLLDRVDPTSPVPMLIVGGKGSGKTHLMRYLSYPLQKLRAPDSQVTTSIQSEGYLGVYVLSGGLNGSRFRGKGQDHQRWEDVFAYNFELWLCRLLLGIIADALSQQALAPDQESKLTGAIMDLFDAEPFKADSLDDIREGLRDLQKRSDLAINNASSTRRLDIEILCTRGNLFFGVPRALREHVPFLSSVRILYLIDEFENFTEAQQMYVNTLVRERVDPVGIKIGARAYGIRTLETLSAGESNRPDSEFVFLKLDLELRQRPDSEYRRFVERLFAKRLAAAGYSASDELGRETIAAFFEEPSDEVARRHERNYLLKKYAGRERPYMATLRKRLEAGIKHQAAPGVVSSKDIEQVLSNLAVREDPFCERLNVFLFYRAWPARSDLVEESRHIGEDGAAFVGGKQDTTQQDALSHWRSDVWAQLRMDTDRQQEYVGFEAFVLMSAGLPRCALTILKHIFAWSLFYGEKPFGGKPISTRAQRAGVAAAAEWFFSEARAPGEIGTAIRSSMARIGELLRALRFADKPPECALSTFSVDETTASEEAKRVLAAAELWSMLIGVANGQHEKNTGRVDPKYRIHPMLAPRWDLPYTSRGAIGLSGAEASVIFGSSTYNDTKQNEFQAVKDVRVARATAPLFGRASIGNPQQVRMPGIDND